MFTGDTIDGKTAALWGLANEAVPATELESAAMKLATRIAGVPRSHLLGTCEAIGVSFAAG
jgi:enoyl-CoA hydratase